MTHPLPVSPHRCVHRLLRLLHALSLGACLRAADDPIKSFDVPAGNAAQTLKQFAAQAGREIVFSPDLVGAVKTNAAYGQLTAREALDRLLAGTGLVAGQDDKTGAFAVRKGSPAPNAPRAAPATTSSDRPSQSAKVDEEKTLVLETFEVFGSKLLNMDIPRSRDDAQPYVIYGRTAIEQSGATNLSDFFKQRLTMNSAATTPDQSADTRGALSQVNLRGLGAMQTLILIDGHRTAGTNAVGVPDQPDLNGIPLSAIERIEVLPTTASGIYGGSATGGVINVVLRRDYAGAELKATYENTLHGDAALRRVDLNAGFTLERGRTNVLLAASWTDQNAVVASDRGFVQRNRAAIVANNPATYLNAATPLLGATPNIRSSTGANLTLKNGTALNSPITFVPAAYAGSNTDGGAALVANAGRYNLNLADSAQPGGGRVALVNAPTIESLTLTVRRQFSPNLQAFIDASVNNNTGHYLTNFATSTFSLPATAPTNPFAQAVTVAVPYSSVAGDAVSTQYARRIVAGVIAQLPWHWQAEADFSWNRTRFNVYTPSGLTAAGTAAVTSGALNVLRDTQAFPVDFSPYLGPGPAVSLIPFRSTLRDATVRLAGPLGSLPAGAPRIAALLEHRDENFADAVLLLAGGLVTNLYPSRAQETDSVYVEGKLPVFSAKNKLPGVEELDLQLAVRRDDYTTKGVTTFVGVGSTTPIQRTTNKTHSIDPTIALRYRPVRDLSLRASFGTGFVAPAVFQVQPRVSTGNTVFTDPRRGNVSVTLPPGTVVTVGNPNLKPENSETWSFGAILSPGFAPGFRLSLDYVRIEKTDVIASHPFGAQGIVNDETLFPGRVTRGAAATGDVFGVGPIVGLNNTFLNLTTAKIEAFDAQLDYRIESAAGTFDLFAMATWQPRYRTQTLPSQSVIENAGIQSDAQAGFGVPLKFRMNGGLTWTRERWTLGWSMAYFDSYLIANPAAATAATAFLNQGSRSVASQVYHDVFARHRFASVERSGFARVLAGTEIQIGSKNVLNTEPPLATSTSSFGYSQFGDPRQARYYVSAKRTF